MPFELAVWHEPDPITRERAATVELGTVEPYPGVAAFAEEFAARFPDADLVTEDSRCAIVAMRPDEADRLSTEVYALARVHGLVCYDPYRELVHDIGATGIEPEMQLHTGDGMIVLDPDLQLVRDVLATLSPETNPFATLVVSGRHFIQTSPEPSGDGGYELEYKDSTQNELLRTHVSELADVQRSFKEYAKGDRTFLDRHDWARPA